MADTADKAGLVAVTNHWPASGGADREALEEAQARTRKVMRTAFQAVTSADYEELARDTPGLRVKRAKAFPLKAPDVMDASGLKEAQASVTVIVVPYSAFLKPTPSAGFCKTVLRHLESHRLITAQIYVIGPYYIGVSIKASVYLQSLGSVTGTRKPIEDTLRRFLSPLDGGPDGKGWPFGRWVYRSEIYQTIENVPGVDYVEGIVLSSSDNINESDGDIETPPHGLVYVDDLSQLQIFPADPTREAKGGSS